MECQDAERSADHLRVLIVGMHRSGTSALAQVLSALEVDFGTNLLSASHANPFGHFEDKFVLNHNEDLLVRAGGCWDAPPQRAMINSEWSKSRMSLLSYLKALADQKPAFAVKEPRTALMLDLYLGLDFFTHVIFITRNSEDIERSLRARNAFSKKYAKRLNSHYISELKASYDECKVAKITLSYEDMISDKDRFISSVNTFLGMHHKADIAIPARDAIVSGDALRNSISNFDSANLLLAALSRPIYAASVVKTRVRRLIKRMCW